MDRLVIGDRDVGDDAGDFRRDHRDVAADIGVVGAFDEAPDGPPVDAVPGRAEARPAAPRRPAQAACATARMSGRRGRAAISRRNAGAAARSAPGRSCHAPVFCSGRGIAAARALVGSRPGCGAERRLAHAADRCGGRSAPAPPARLSRVDDHDACPFGREMLVAPGQQRPQHRAEIAAALGQHILVARRPVTVARGAPAARPRPAHSAGAPGCSARCRGSSGTGRSGVSPRKASRRIRMLHHSPTRSRLRAMGHCMVPKFCAAWEPPAIDLHHASRI